MIALRRVLPACWGLALAGSFYLLCIDIATLPELLAGAAVVALGALGFVVARHEGVGEASVSAHELGHALRAVLRVPRGVATLIAEAARQTVRPRAVRGRVWALPFEPGTTPRGLGREATVEAFGSLAPDTIVIGVDAQRSLLIVHQLGDGPPPETMGLGVPRARERR